MNPRPNLRAIAARALIAPPAKHTFGPEVPIPAAQQHALQQLGNRLAAELDDAIIEALGRHLKRAVAGPAELQRLAAGVTCTSQLVGPEPGDTYSFDGVDILWAGPITVEEEGAKIRAGREVRQLLEPAP